MPVLFCWEYQLARYCYCLLLFRFNSSLYWISRPSIEGHFGFCRPSFSAFSLVVVGDFIGECHVPIPPCIPLVSRLRHQPARPSHGILEIHALRASLPIFSLSKLMSVRHSNFESSRQITTTHLAWYCSLREREVDRYRTTNTYQHLPTPSNT